MWSKLYTFRITQVDFKTDQSKNSKFLLFYLGKIQAVKIKQVMNTSQMAY